MLGFNFVAEGFEGPFSYDDPESISSLAVARSAGVNSFTLSFPWYIESINSTGPIYPVSGGCPTGAPFNNASSPSNASVVTAIRAIHALGASVVLRPLIDPHWSATQKGSGCWRGEIGTHFTPAQWDAFFASYTDFILFWAGVAAAEEVETFCIGGELSDTQSQSTHWRALFSRVRAVFPGIVYYSSTDSPVDWWDASDYIAVDMYPSLSSATADPTEVSVASLVAAWEPYLQKYHNLSLAYGKPLLMQETGICSVNKVGLYSQPAFFECYGLPLDQDVQKKYYEAILLGPFSKPWVTGIAFWKWGAQGGPNDPTFFPLNKSAMQVFQNFSEVMRPS